MDSSLSFSCYSCSTWWHHSRDRQKPTGWTSGWDCSEDPPRERMKNSGRQMMKTRTTRMRSLVSVALVMSPPCDQTHWDTQRPRPAGGSCFFLQWQTNSSVGTFSRPLGVNSLHELQFQRTKTERVCHRCTATHTQHVLSATSLPFTLPVLMHASNGGFKTKRKVPGSSVWVEPNWGSARQQPLNLLSVCVNGSPHRSQGDRAVYFLFIFLKKNVTREWEGGQLIMTGFHIVFWGKISQDYNIP